MRDAFLDTESVRGVASEPASGLGDEEVCAGDNEDQCPRAAVARACEVGGFGFSWKALLAFDGLESRVQVRDWGDRSTSILACRGGAIGSHSILTESIKGRDAPLGSAKGLLGETLLAETIHGADSGRCRP
jgi:hypothetical protein